MKPKLSVLLALVVASGILRVAPVNAQEHRATRLGHPSTRFAPPLRTTADLRMLLRDEHVKADVTSILLQWGWKGDVEDLRRAVATAEIVEWKIPVGARMPFMSSRKNGEPVLLRDVLWAGERPIDAYAFVFSSRGRRYRCITPKACSNFWVEDIGPETPRLSLVKTAPTEVRICDAVEMMVAVRNAGSVGLTEVQVVDSLPEGLKTSDGRTTLVFDAGALEPGQTREFKFNVVASAGGRYQNQARATSTQGATAVANAVTTVRKPALAIECVAPEQVFAGRPAKVCLTVNNSGDASEDTVTVALPIPAGAMVVSTSEGAKSSEGRLVWEIPSLTPGTSRQLCAEFTLPQPGALSFTAAARGVCAEPVEARCSTRVAGIPAILLEVIDLEDPVEVGQEETYEIKVTNQGSAVDTNIKVTCLIEDTQEFVSGAGATAVQTQDRIITVATLPALAPKAEATWRVVVKALKAGDVRFSVALTSDQIERPVTETEATQQY